MRASSAVSANAGADAGATILTSEGWWVGLGSKAAHEAKGANAWSLWQARRVEGIPVALAEALVPRIHVTDRLLSLHRARPAPPLHTRRVLPAERRETAWALVAGGQQGRCRGVGWGRWDGLIGYDIPTAGRLCAAPISGMGQPGQAALANAP
jgi:hypothetical protein